MLNDFDFERHWEGMESDAARLHFMGQQIWKVSKKVDNLPCQKEGNCPSAQTIQQRLSTALGLGSFGGALAFGIIWGIGKIEQWW